MVLSHYLYKGTNTQHVAGMQERSYDFSKGGGGGGSNKLNSPDCQVDLHAVFTRKDPHLQNIP